jgi:gliding motility-associated-like protein
MCQSFPTYTRLIFRAGLIGICVFGNLCLSATVTTEPSATCLSCDGIATIETTFPGMVLFEWYDELGNLIFSEQNAAGISIIPNLCAGIYSVQWTNGTLNDYEFFNIDTSTVSAGEWSELVTCEDGSGTSLFPQLQGIPQSGGDWYAPDGSAFSGIFDPAINPPGTYYYQVDGGACSVTNGIDVTVNQNADPGLSTTYLICETYGPFLLTNVLAGSPDLGGQWTFPDQTPFDGIYDTSIHSSGSYFYVIDTVPGCTPVVSVLTIIENTLPNPGESNTVYMCLIAVPFDMATQLGGNPQNNGFWTNAINQPVNAIFDPATDIEGTYTYTVPAATPCTQQEADLTIVFTAGISAGQNTNVNVCSLAGLLNLYDQLEGSPTPEGMWFDPNGNIIEETVDPASALSGEYSYEVSAVGCQSESSIVNLQVESPLNAGTDGQIEVCESNSPFMLIDLNSPDADEGGVWTNEQFEVLTNSVSPPANSVWNLTYTLESDVCPNDQATYSIQVDMAPTVMDDLSVEFCQSDEAVDLNNLVVDPSPFSSSFEFAGIPLDNSTFNPASDEPGDYLYTIFSNNACPDETAVLEVIVFEEAFSPVNEMINVCYSEQSIDLTSYFSADILWEQSDWMYNGTSIDPVILVDLNIGGVYTFEVVNNPLCPVSFLSLEIAVVTVPDAGPDGTIVWCEYSGDLNLTTGLDGASSQDGTWYFEGNEVSSIVAPSQANSGSYTFVLDAIGPCPEDESIIEVEFDPGTSINLGNDLEVCSGMDPFEIGVEPELGYTYNWVGSNSLETSSESSSVYLPMNDSNIPISEILILFAQNGVCSTSDTLDIVVNPLPVPSILGPLAVCTGETGTWIAQGGASYVWDGDPSITGSTDQMIEVEITENIVLELSIENEYGCEASATIEVEPMPIPDAYFEASPLTGCTPLQANLINLSENPPGTNYTWVINGDLILSENNPSINFNEEGFHDVELIAISDFGCTNSLLQENYIQAYSIPQSSWTFSPQNISELHTHVEFNDASIGAGTYLWEFSDLGISEESDPTFDFPEIGGMGYQVCQTVWSEYGCENQSCHDLYVQGEFSVFAPNTFTPDQDGLNEVFKPVCQGYSDKDYLLQVFDRWGELIFSSNDPQNAWLGNVNGQGYYAPDGLYQWTLEVRSLYTSEKKELSGFVTLMR